MTIFTKENAYYLGWAFYIIVSIVSLAELAYVYCILERKECTAEHRIIQCEQIITDLTIKLNTIQNDLLNTQLEYLAKSRTIRREVRVLHNKFNKETDSQYHWSVSVYRELRAIYKHAKIIDLEEDQSQQRSDLLRNMNIRLYNRDTDTDMTEQE